MAVKGAGRGGLTAVVGVVSRGANQIVMIAVTLLATRYLDPRAFGVFSLAAAAVTLGRSLLYTGPFEFLLKAKDEAAASRACLAANAILAVGFNGLITLGAFLSAPLFKAPELGLVMLGLAPSSLIAAGAAWLEAQILRSGSLRAYYLTTVAGEVAAGAAAAALLVSGFGVTALVVQAYVRPLALGAGYLVLRRPNLARPAGGVALREVLAWSRARYAATVTGFLSNYGADFIIGALLSPAAAGVYRAGSRIVTAVSDLFSQPASLICMTLFSRRAAAGKGGGDLLPRVWLGVALVAWPALAGMAVVARDLSDLLLGDRWKGVAPVIAVLCLGRAMGVMSAVASPYLVAYNRQATLLKIQTTSAACLLLGLLVAARFGLTAAAFAPALTAAAMFLWIGIEALGMARPPGAALARAGLVLATVLAATVLPATAVLTLVPDGRPLRLWLAIAAGAAGWGAAALVFRAAVADSVKAFEPA